MADINSDGNSGGPGAQPERPAYRASSRDSAATPQPVDDKLVGLVELLFFAYRDFTGEADAVLAKFGFGRAHHRVLHFVSRNPGIRVADLLDILRITKQSLARVLKQLVDEGYIEQHAGVEDRRERKLHATRKGRTLASELMGLQSRRIAEALQLAGPAAEVSAERFLYGIISPEERTRVLDLLRGADSKR